jgi:hypothetical protein
MKQFETPDISKDINLHEEEPIKEGEFFDPDKEICKVTSAPKEERAARLDEFRERLTYQKEGLSKLQELLIDIIWNNPEIDQRELLIRIEPFIDKYGLSDKQIEEIHKIISEYDKRHMAVTDFAEKFPDSKTAFQQLFGFEPSGSVEMLISPITIHFRLQDRNDFSRARNSDSDKSDEKIKESKYVTGTYLLRKSFNDLEKCIVIENVVGRETDIVAKTSTHELQHALSDFFEEILTERISGNNPYSKDELFFDSAEKLINSSYDDEEFKAGLEDFFKDVKNKALIVAQSEIISWYSEGESINSIAEIIRGYNHLNKWKSIAEHGLSAALRIHRKYHGKKFDNVDIKQISGEIAGDEEFFKVIDSALAAILVAEDGGMRRREIISLVRAEPLTKWFRTIKQTLERREKKNVT